MTAMIRDACAVLAIVVFITAMLLIADAFSTTPYNLIEVAFLGPEHLRQ